MWQSLASPGFPASSDMASSEGSVPLLSVCLSPPLDMMAYTAAADLNTDHVRGSGVRQPA